MFGDTKSIMYNELSRERNVSQYSNPNKITVKSVITRVLKEDNNK